VTRLVRFALMLRQIRRTIRAVAILARDGQIPRPLRGAAALGLLPVPGPFDEAVLLVVALVLWLFYPDRLKEAWRRAQP
jgi:hypothetical protein